MNVDFVCWDDAYLIGFELIDNQHKELVRMTNDLFEGCKKGASAADVAFMRTIRDAIDYAQTHFYTEEKYMEHANYPEVEIHKQEHRNFVGTIKKAVHEFEEKNSDPLMLARFLKQWLLSHIAQMDKRYGPCLKGIK